MSLDLNFTDGNTHQVAVYLLDWDNYGPRTERVDIVDANNNTLDTRTAASFTGGQYLVWNLSGHVIVRITNTNGSSNAAVSGIFFGSPAQPPVSVTLGPASVALGVSQTQQFTATVANGAPGVTWSLNPIAGAISAGGLYTAPNRVQSIARLWGTVMGIGRSFK